MQARSPFLEESVTACVVFATTTEVVTDVVKSIDIPDVQDMFVGKPSF
jgi:hypothetical protein